MSHPAELGWICVAINYHFGRATPGRTIDVGAPGVVKAHISEIRRLIGLHRHHRWFGRRPPVVTGRANAE